MNVQEQINENTILHFVEDNRTSFDENDKAVVDIFLLSFSFYDKHYDVFVRAKDLNEEDGFANIQMSGDSDLFDGFESLCEGEHWEYIAANAKSLRKNLMF